MQAAGDIIQSLTHLFLHRSFELVEILLPLFQLLRVLLALLLLRHLKAQLPLPILNLTLWTPGDG